MSYNAQMYSSAGQQPTIWGNNAGIPEDISLQAIENPKAPDVKGDPMTQVLKTGASMVADYYAPGSGQLVSAALSNVGGGGPGQFVAGQTPLGDNSKKADTNTPFMTRLDSSLSGIGEGIGNMFAQDNNQQNNSQQNGTVWSFDTNKIANSVGNWFN